MLLSPILAVEPITIVLLIAGGIVVIGVGTTIFDYFSLRSQFQNSTAVGVAHLEPAAGTFGGTYTSRATLIPAAIGGASATGKIIGLTMIFDSFVTPTTPPTTTTPGWTGGSFAIVGTASNPPGLSLFVSGPGTSPADMTYTAGAGDVAWTRRVLQVRIQFPFTVFFFFTATGEVTYKEFVPGPYSTAIGAPPTNSTLSGIPG
jgi:hypothetical protein